MLTQASGGQHFPGDRDMHFLTIVRSAGKGYVTRLEFQAISCTGFDQRQCLQ